MNDTKTMNLKDGGCSLDRYVGYTYWGDIHPVKFRDKTVVARVTSHTPSSEGTTCDPLVYEMVSLPEGCYIEVYGFTTDSLPDSFPERVPIAISPIPENEREGLAELLQKELKDDRNPNPDAGGDLPANMKLVYTREEDAVLEAIAEKLGLTA